MTDQTSRTDAVKKVGELLKDSRIGMMTTVAPDGTFISRPMALQEAEFNGDLWFFAAADSRKATHIASNPHVNIAIANRDSWVSLTGTGRIVRDDAKKAELWDASVEAWFPDGKDDPNIVLIEVEGDSAEYWDSPGGTISTAISLVKSKVTGKPMDGENERVEL